MRLDILDGCHCNALHSHTFIEYYSHALMDVQCSSMKFCGNYEIAVKIMKLKPT